jgi:hypothetical protein
LEDVAADAIDVVVVVADEKFLVL